MHSSFLSGPEFLNFPLLSSIFSILQLIPISIFSIKSSNCYSLLRQKSCFLMWGRSLSLLCLLPQPQKQTRKNASRDLHKFSLQKFHNHKVSSISIKFPSMESLTYLNFNVIRIKDDGNGGNIQLFFYIWIIKFQCFCSQSKAFQLYAIYLINIIIIVLIMIRICGGSAHEIRIPTFFKWIFHEKLPSKGIIVIPHQHIPCCSREKPDPQKP